MLWPQARCECMGAVKSSNNLNSPGWSARTAISGSLACFKGLACVLRAQRCHRLLRALRSCDHEQMAKRCMPMSVCSSEILLQQSNWVEQTCC